MRALLILAAMTLVGCKAAPEPKANPPAPTVIELPVATYVPIDAALTKRCQWVRDDAKPSQVFEVSAGRRSCLLKYEAQFDGIKRVEGKPVP